MKQIILDVCGIIITAIVSYLGIRLKNYMDSKEISRTKKSVVRDTVKYVNQVYKDIDGSEKLEKAMKSAAEILSEKGIMITELELRVLIESAVNTIKEKIQNGESNKTEEKSS